GNTQRPLADVARLALGEKGAVLVTVGALISCCGYLSAKIVGVPRVTYALAERGDFPKIFAAVHSRYRTPYFSILVFAVLTWLLAQLGSFRWNLTLSAVARLVYYGVGCAAPPVLRRTRPGSAVFPLPGGPVFPVARAIVCAVLLTHVHFGKSLILIPTVVA